MSGRTVRIKIAPPVPILAVLAPFFHWLAAFFPFATMLRLFLAFFPIAARMFRPWFAVRLLWSPFAAGALGAPLAAR